MGPDSFAAMRALAIAVVLAVAVGTAGCGGKSTPTTKTGTHGYPNKAPGY
jgi:hypothetical protein